jgi:hypothetical protein
VVYTALAMFGMESQGSAAILDTPTIQVFQYLLVLAGVAGSAYTAYRISKARAGESAGAPSWLPVAALIVILGAVNLVLFYLPMEMRM